MFCYRGAETINKFSIKNIKIKKHGSLYPDDDVLDFYIATFDKINNE